LQNADPEEIANSGFDLIVMDYSYDGSEDGEYSPQEIQLIKSGGVIPIAYLSIGEAEDYRFYWRDEWSENPPDWLGKENPEWEGNYPVKYWVDEWKDIIFSYLDRIISQGFAGVYLDRIDSFEYWSDPDNGEDIVLSEEDAAIKMINFVLEIAEYCRETRGLSNFYIIPQNGERILEYDKNGIYLETISGIGIEDLWYKGLDPNPAQVVEERIQYIDQVAIAGKIVLSIDYVDDGSGYKGENKERIDDYVSKAREQGYIPYVGQSDRALDELVIIPGVQPYKPSEDNEYSVLGVNMGWVYLVLGPVTVVIILLLIRIRRSVK